MRTLARIKANVHGLLHMFDGCCLMVSLASYWYEWLYIPWSIRFIGCTCGEVFLDNVKDAREREMIERFMILGKW